MFLTEYAIRRWFYFPPYLTNVSVAYTAGFDIMPFQTFITIPACDRRTDRQTVKKETDHSSAYRTSTESCSKNGSHMMSVVIA